MIYLTSSLLALTYPDPDIYYLLPLFVAPPEQFSRAVKDYEVVEVLFGLLTRLKQRSDHPMIGVLCGDQQSVYNISMVYKCVMLLRRIAKTPNTKVPGKDLPQS